MRRAELAVEEAYALTGAARASLYPDLAITGGSASSTFLGLTGEVNGLDVLTAEQSLLTAKLNQIDDRYQEMLYAVNLYRALGGGAERTAD